MKGLTISRAAAAHGMLIHATSAAAEMLVPAKTIEIEASAVTTNPGSMMSVTATTAVVPLTTVMTQEAVATGDRRTSAVMIGDVDHRTLISE